MVRTNAALRRSLLYAPNGAVGRDLRRRAVRVQNRSKILVGAKRAVDSGRLRSTIETTDPRPHPKGQIISIGSNLVYSLAVHDPAKYGPPSWKKAAARGRPVPARHYLTEALPAARS